MTLLEELRVAGVLSDLDVLFAERLGALADERRGEVLLAAALASRAVRQGHVCLDLARTVRDGMPADDTGAPAAAAAIPSLAPWAASLRDSRMVTTDTSDAAPPVPLVLDAAHRLYLRRYWLYERSLAAAIAARAAASGGVDGPVLAAGLARLFGAGPAEGPDMQRAAARTAVTRRFCVISGGPGTGKTHTVVRILALAIEQALAVDAPAPAIALMAPTGKAAARLREAVRGGVASLACAPAVRAAIPLEATTIHRALGATRRGGSGFRRHRGDPLRADLVVVDEASMVDLALMARLFDALPPGARVVLLGDRDQLASVEAGAVLGDICNSGETRDGAGGAPVPGIADAIVQLDRSYRFGGGITALAAAINAGSLSAVWAALDAGGEVGWHPAAADGGLGVAGAALVADGLADFCRAGTATERMRALERFRVLCAHRHGPGGVVAVNAQVEQLLTDRGVIRIDGEWYVGRPILVTRNDYHLQLFNGDVGIIAAADGDPSRRLAVFINADGSERRLSPARLPPHETVFAMSVHKSQGSEFDAVAVVLPPEPSPVVSRELLYTAITRARRQATIIAPRAVVDHGVTHAIARASGLRDRLWRA